MRKIYADGRVKLKTKGSYIPNNIKFGTRIHNKILLN